MRTSFLAAAAASLLVVLGGCGTTPYDIMKSERQHAEAEHACSSAGLHPGTNQFATCMQDRTTVMRAPVTPSDVVSPR